MGDVLERLFASSEFTADMIRSCITEAVTLGEDMLMKFKEKSSAVNRAVIYLRYLDSGRYHPLLRVYDLNDTVILEKDLPETNDLDMFGELLVSSKKVTIKPRKKCIYNRYEPCNIRTITASYVPRL